MLRSLSSYLLAASLATTAGCGPKRLPSPGPQPDLPASFSTSGTASLPDRWWLAIDDPTLHRLIDEGLSDNPGLLATWERLAQADATARREGASRYPSLTGDASFGGSANDGGTSTSTSLGLAASYEIDLFGGIGAARDAAAIDARASRADLSSAAITLSAEIASAWYTLVEQDRQLELLAAQREAAARTLSLVELKFDQGAIAETDLIRQKQAVESIDGDLALARARATVSRHRLAILLGKPPGAALPATADVAALPPLPATGVPGELVQRRPDVVRTYLAVQSADKQVAVAISERFPRLSISLRAATSGALPQDLFASWLASLVGSIAGPIFDGGSRAANVDRARAALAERVQLYRAAVLDALAEVEDALAEETRQVEYLDSVSEQLGMARDVLTRTRDAYGAGMIDYLRVLEAEDSVRSLERRELTARRELIDYRIGLYRALAGGWKMTRPSANT